MVTEAPQWHSEVEARLGKPFDVVREQLVELFDNEWDEVLVVIETSATKTGKSHAQVVVELVERSTAKPPVQSRVKRGLVRWIGKPWRERENPWDRFKHKVPPPPPRIDEPSSDLDEWTPLKPDQDAP